MVKEVRKAYVVSNGLDVGALADDGDEVTKLAKADEDFDAPEFTPEDWADLKMILTGLHNAGVADTAEIVGGGLATATTYARTRAAQLLGMSLDEETGEWVTNPDLKWAVTATVRDKVRAALARSVEEGQPRKEFRAALEEAIGKDIPYRASMIARTEGREAYNNGAAANFRDMGVDNVEVLDGSGLDDICDEQDGMVVSLDEFLAISADRHPNCTIGPAPVLDATGEGE